MTNEDVKARLEFYIKRLQIDIRTIHKLLDKCKDVPDGSYKMCIVRMDKCIQMLLATMSEIGVQIEYPRCEAKDSDCPPGVLDLSDTSMLNGVRYPLPEKVPTISSVDPFTSW